MRRAKLGDDRYKESNWILKNNGEEKGWTGAKDSWQVDRKSSCQVVKISLECEGKRNCQGAQREMGEMEDREIVKMKRDTRFTTGRVRRT